MGMLRRIKCLASLTLLPALVHAQAGNSYTQSNLVSDGTVRAQQTDPNLINPWGIAIGQQTPFWINAAGTGLSEVYDEGGNKKFVVTIPAATGSNSTGSPTGIAYNSSTGDFVLKQGGPALFIFDSLDGTISGWNTSLTNAQKVVDNSASGAVYTGLAIENNGTANYILAANFAQNEIDVFDNEFARITLSGHFVDPNLPSGYAPFNVHVLNNQVYVMYDLQTPGGGPPTTGAGTGFVSVFDTNGNFLKRAISGGKLNAPWGIALAPSSFGVFGGDLLFGNFGDGTINAFDPATFTFKGQLQDANGKTIVNDRLWEILFGQNGTGDTSTLYFSAGVNEEKGGLFGAINVTAPANAGDFQIGVSVPTLTLTQGASGTATISVMPENGFKSAVSLSVSGLPAGLTFQFAPSSVTPTAGSAVSSILTLSPTTYTPPPPGPYSARSHAGSTVKPIVTASAILPLGLAALFPFWRRLRSKSIEIAAGSLSLLIVLFTLAGCGGSSKASGVPTPVTPGTSTVTVTATSGSIVHTATFSLVIQ
jgi:uncharacterized protein (TIGR03118 family)